ncbi:MAG: AraC family transcriptional regulator [Uliginosibacterium sp.]|nr:AraC family transcriptional regulator [Uliginosibacterium sp.]
MTRIPDKRSDKTAAFALRMNRVIDHIDRHLGEELRLEALASVAAFSPYHFHRLFRAWTGETLQDFVRHRRLEKAGGQLVHNPAVAIQHIGQLCGFTSAEAFSRAFAQHFGMSPSAWRAGRYKDWDPVRGAPNEPVPRQLGVQVQHQAALSVAYVRVHGDYAQTPDEAWGQLLPWMAAHGLDTALRLGMALDDPTITAPARCRYDACVVLPADFSAPGERVARKTIAAGVYASLSWQGPRNAVGAAWLSMLGDWLPQSGCTLGEEPFVERYAAGQDPRIDPVSLDLCMPMA